MSFSTPKDKSLYELYQELYKIQRRYSEYREMGFEKTVKMFATDDFYHLHLIAKAFLTTRSTNMNLIEAIKNEQFVEENEDKVYDYVSLNLDSFLAPEDMPLDDNWEEGVNKAINELINDLNHDEFMKKIGANALCN